MNEQMLKGLKGGGKKDNAEEVAQVVASTTLLYQQTPVKDNEELKNRLRWYFLDYARDGIIPTPEGMCLAIGSTWSEVNKFINKGKDEERIALLSRALSYIAEVSAQLVSSGKMPSVPYIFRGKNFFGMSDEQQVVLSAGTVEKTKEELIAEAEALPSLDILTDKALETEYAEVSPRRK